MPGDDASIGSYASSSSEESHGEEKWEDPVKDPTGGMGQSADPGKTGTQVNMTALTNVRYCTLIQPTLLPRRGDQFSMTAIVPTNPFTKL